MALQYSLPEKRMVPSRRVEGGTLAFDVDDISVQLPGELGQG